MSDRLAMYIDTSKCMACRGCQVACKQWNDRRGYVPGERETRNTGSYENPLSLDPETWTRITFHELDDGERFQWLFLKEGCMHCTHAACVEVCPTHALKYGPHGIVTYERDLCNGCGYCSQFCPFHVPKLEVINRLTGEAKSSKCVFCQDRTTNGLKPACVKTCPAGALDWGERDGMIAQAQSRVELLRSAQGFAQANVYGETQLGGLGRIYVLTAPPAAYGLPENPKYPVMAAVQKVLQPLGQVAFGGTVLAAITAWIIARRNVRMEEVE
ncbi:MAG TPA: 4Fe-4S dicluster domain-containing protein [Anaerolineae bacterium]|nr:4Fe-4S dicluster domain-containing protein [Anaerolineae bacterium]